MKKSLHIFVLIICCLHINAKDYYANLDSLLLQEKQLEVINLITSFEDFPDSSSPNNVKKGLKIIKQYNKLVSKYKDSSGECKGNCNFLTNVYYALAYKRTGQLDSAFVSSKRAYSYYLSYGRNLCLHDHSEKMWNSVFADYGVLAIVRDYYLAKNQIDKALEQSKSIVDSCKMYCSYLSVAKVLDTEGNLYFQKGDILNSIKVRRDALLRRSYVPDRKAMPQASMILYNMLETVRHFSKEWIRRIGTGKELNKDLLESTQKMLNTSLILYYDDVITRDLESGLFFWPEKALLSSLNCAIDGKQYKALIAQEKNVEYFYQKHNNSCEYANILLLLNNAYISVLDNSQDAIKESYLSHADSLLSKAAKIWQSDSIKTIVAKCVKHNSNEKYKNAQNQIILDWYCDFLNQWCNHYISIHELDSAEMWVNHYLTLAKRRKKEVYIPYLHLGEIDLQNIKYKCAEKDIKFALDYATQENDTIGMVESYIKLSQLYESYPCIYKNDEEIESYLSHAYNMIMNYNPHMYDKKNYMMQKMAEIYYNRYKYDYAEELLTSSLINKEFNKELISDDEYVREAQCNYERYGFLVPTDRLLEKIKIIAERADSTRTVLQASELLGGYYWTRYRNDSIEKTVYYCQKALDIAKCLKDHKTLAKSLLNLCDIYLIKEDYNKALEYAIESEQFDSGNIPPEIFYIASHVKMENLVNSRIQPLFNNVKDIFFKNLLFTDSDAREFLIRKFNSSYRIMGSMVYYYPESTLCSEVAYNSQLLMKGLLVHTQNSISDYVEKSKDKILQSNYSKYVDLRSLLKKDTYGVVYDKQNIQLGMQISALEKEILNKVSQKRFFSDLNVTWKDVRNHLKENEVAIEFVEISNFDFLHGSHLHHYGALILRKDFTSPKFVELGTKEDIDRVIYEILHVFNSKVNPTQEKWDFLSKELYSIIWGKLEEYVSWGDKIYFSMAGMLHQAPLEILHDKDGRIVNDKYLLYRLSSTRELCYHKERSLSSVALYGGLVYDKGIHAEKENSFKDSHNIKNNLRYGWQYLPSTAVEVDNIAMQLDSAHIRTYLRKGQSGTEKSFRKLSGKNMSILHIATHGFFFNNEDVKFLSYFNNERNEYISPMKRTGLMMSGGGAAWLGSNKLYKKDEDGILLAEEIASLDLKNTEMVVISACQTGLGEIDSSGEGVFGIQRAFKIAGVNTLVMTLGKVDDKASQLFMQSFYGFLISGVSTYESFRKAQEYVRNYKYENSGHITTYSNPKYWAPFVLLDAIN